MQRECFRRRYPEHRLKVLLGKICFLVIFCSASTAQDDWAERDFWQTTDGKQVSDGWEFKDGAVALVKPGQGGNIVSRPLPSNFELSFSWKIQKGVNGGLKYRVRRFGTTIFDSNYLGLEYQILDNPADSTSNTSTASIYDLVGPKKEKTLHPPGQWNQAKIVALGDSIEHYLNGELVTTGTTSGAAWDTLIAFSKFYGARDFGRSGDQDRFMLTDHGGVTIYKDFVFKPLNAPDLKAIDNEGPFLANASRNSWADQRSIVLWTRTTSRPEILLDGKPFKSISNGQASELAKLKDPSTLEQLQLPDGAGLDEMIGACPGKAGRVRLSYFQEEHRKDVKSLEWITTQAANDFTAQWKLEGLKPGVTYITILEAQNLDGSPTAAIRGAFKTAPAESESSPVKFCITTCHDFIRRDDGPNGHKIYPAMKAIAPDFIVHAGDIEYYDKPDPWALTVPLMRFKWGRIFGLPSNRDFYNHTTSYFIKDDHDTLANDCWPGQTYGAVTFAEGKRLFNEEQFPSKPERYQTVLWGKELQLWILEGRDFRSPNTLADGPEKTILGAQQKAWLSKSLQESKATYKLICTPTPIVGPDRDNKKDNHANAVFEHEGNELRQMFSKVPGVILFCGDRHWQYASVDEVTKVWEFGCGPGSENHELGWKVGDTRPEHRFLRVQGGFLSGELTYDATGSIPRLTIRHHDVSGKQVSEFAFPESFKVDGLQR
ncbi:MAG: family 16 glycoside hydrolase [Planctomycetota bacterium]|jgi:alkaline phosphatase D